ncbi:Fe-S-containing protein [Thermodesulfobacteriota bacterium]
MSKKKKSTRNVNKRAAKREAVLGSEKKNRTPLFAAFVIAILLSSGALAFYALNGKSDMAAATPSAVAADTHMVAFPVNLFSDGKARHFEYKHGDITVRYFILKSSDGIIRAAFDACDVCWPAGKGYYQEGDTMVCRNCGRRFASVLVNEVKGGCNPAPLNREVKGNELILRINDIVEGKQYFNFSNRT